MSDHGQRDRETPQGNDPPGSLHRVRMVTGHVVTGEQWRELMRLARADVPALLALARELATPRRVFSVRGAP